MVLGRLNLRLRLLLLQQLLLLLQPIHVIHALEQWLRNFPLLQVCRVVIVVGKHRLRLWLHFLFHVLHSDVLLVTFFAHVIAQPVLKDLRLALVQLVAVHFSFDEKVWTHLGLVLV